MNEITIRLDAFAVRLQRLEVALSDLDHELADLVTLHEEQVKVLRADLDQIRASVPPGMV